MLPKNVRFLLHSVGQLGKCNIRAELRTPTIHARLRRLAANGCEKPGYSHYLRLLLEANPERQHAAVASGHGGGSCISRSLGFRPIIGGPLLGMV